MTRPAAGRKVGDKVERLVALTPETQPAGVTHRSMRAMAKRAGMGRVMASRVRRAFGLASHRHEAFKP